MSATHFFNALKNLILSILIILIIFLKLSQIKHLLTVITRWLGYKTTESHGRTHQLTSAARCFTQTSVTLFNYKTLYSPTKIYKFTDCEDMKLIEQNDRSANIHYECKSIIRFLYISND